MTKGHEIAGKVFIVGAGPGDPGLLTLKGKACLEQADVVLFDYLANPALLDFVPAQAEQIYCWATRPWGLWKSAGYQ